MAAETNFSLIVNHPQKTIHYTHTGVLNKEEIGLAWTELLKMEEFTQLKYNLLTDYSQAHFDMAVSDCDLIVNFLATLEPVLKDKKQAMIVSEPRNTALCLLFESEVNKHIGFIVRIFSSRPAAIQWLGQ